jgi:predicted CXXCH cytochrome family protein
VASARPLLVLAALLWCAAPAAAGGHPPVDGAGACVTAACHAAAPRGPAAASVHDPYAGGDCRSCHDLALAAATRYVRGAPAGDGPDRSRPWDLQLCAGCHGESLYARSAPPGATAFADGGSNLHALHVQAGRGRRCLTCHEPHAARQPALLRERIPAAGGARIPQQFRAEPTGGWCRTGCHAPKRYRR